MGVNWTASQQSAINEKGVDLLVSASAGSGKTTVMIERIASMLRAGEVAVDELLVLTFTKASAADMRAKLRKKLGEEFDLSIAQIGTFHQFCANLIRTYFNLVDLDPGFDILDDVDARAVQGEILDELIARNLNNCQEAIFTFCVNRKTNALKDLIVSISNFLATRENPQDWMDTVALSSYAGTPAIIQDYIKEVSDYYIEKFSSFNVTEKMRPCIDFVLGVARNLTMNTGGVEFPRIKIDKEFSEYEEYKVARNNFKEEVIRLAGHLGQSSAEQQEQDKRVVEQVILLVREFIAKYADEKRRMAKLDFADLEQFALAVLKNPIAVEAVREKYKFIFVDEYQDTSPVQEQILSLVGRPNGIFLVGDVKQSIYGFRGCEVSIFANRLTDFENNLGGRAVMLNENFRSNPQILGFVNGVFAKIMPDYSRTGKFSLPEKFQNTNCVEVILLEGKSEEESAILKQCAFVARKINELMRENKNLRYSDFAILSRSATHHIKLARILKTAGIPSMQVAKHKASDLPEIVLLHDFLFATANHTNELPKAKVMMSSVIDEDIDWDEFYKFAKTHNVSQILDKFLAKFMVMEKLLQRPEGRQMVARINAYLNKLRGLRVANNLTRFLYQIEHGILDVELDEGASVQDAVQIMTIHKSKGLEFPVVILFDVGARFSDIEKKKYMAIDKECGLCVHSTDLDEWTKSASPARLGALISGQRAQVAEEMRLLYVALTRAKSNLVIIGAACLEKIKMPKTQFEINRSKNYLQFLAHALDDVVQVFDINDIHIEAREIEGGRVLPDIIDENLVANFKEIFTKEQQPIIGADVVFKNSVTSLTRNEEQFSDHKPVPVFKDKDRGIEYGTRFHAEMQKVDFVNPQSEDVNVIKAASVVGEFIANLRVLREVPFLQRMQREGTEILVQGIIDLLAIGKGRAILIDYKTTKASEARLRELYAAQLGIYADAARMATGIESIETYIYSANLGKLILV